MKMSSISLAVFLVVTHQVFSLSENRFRPIPHERGLLTQLARAQASNPRPDNQSKWLPVGRDRSVINRIRMRRSEEKRRDQNKGRVRVTISVKDVGEWGYGNDPVIEYTLVVKEFSPARIEVNAKWYYWFLVRYGVRLGLRYSVYCQRDYYGDLCQVYCRAPTFYDRYTCDPNTGQMICLPGYTGYNCQRRILPTGYPWWWRPIGRGPVPQTRFTTTIASSKSTETMSSSTVNVETPTNTPTSKLPTSLTNTPSSKTDTPTSTTSTQTPIPNTHTSSTDTHIFIISTPTTTSSVPTSSSDTTTSITRTPITTTETPISTVITPNSTLSIHASETHESLSRTVQHVSTTETPSEREDKSGTPLTTTSTQDTQSFTMKTSNLTTDKPTSTTLMLSIGAHVHTPVATVIPSKTYTPTSTEGQSSTPRVTASTAETRPSTMDASLLTSETATFKTDTFTLKTDTSSTATSMDTLPPTITMSTESLSQTPSSTVETSLKSNTPITITDKLTSNMPIASTATHIHTSTVAILTSEADTPISTEDSTETPSFTKEETSVKSQTPGFITDTPAFETNSPSSLTNANAPTTNTPVVGTSIRTDTTVYTPNPTTKSISQSDKMTTIARLIDQTVLPKSETATMKVQLSTNRIAIMTTSLTTMQPTKLAPTESVSSVFEPSTLITEYATAELHSQKASAGETVTTEQTTPLANSTLQRTQYSSETTSLKTSTTVDDRYITTAIVTSETLELYPSREYSKTTNKSSPYPSSSSVEGVTIGPHPTTDTYSVVTDIEYITNSTHVPEITPTKDTTVEESTTDTRSGAISLTTPRSKTKLTKKPTDHRRLKNNTSSRIPTTTMINPTFVDSVTNAVAGNASVSSTSSSKPTVDYTNITDIAIQTTIIDSPDMATVGPNFTSVTNQDSSKYQFFSTSTISTNEMVSTEPFSQNSTESTVRTSVKSPNVTLTATLSSSLTSSSTSSSGDPTVGTSTAVRQPSVLLRNRTFFPIRTMSSRICWTNKPKSCECGRGDLPKLPSIEDYSWTIAFSNGKTDNLPVKFGIS
nr:mucin-2-like isoform X2 [Lytechinus pictus]